MKQAVFCGRIKSVTAAPEAGFACVTIQEACVEGSDTVIWHERKLLVPLSGGQADVSAVA